MKKKSKSIKFTSANKNNDIDQFKESAFIELVMKQYLLTRQQAIEICSVLFMTGCIRYINPLDLEKKEIRGKNNTTPTRKAVAKANQKHNNKIKQNVKEYGSKE
eukprot:Pgem_evm1s19377